VRHRPFLNKQSNTHHEKSKWEIQDVVARILTVTPTRLIDPTILSLPCSQATPQQWTYHPTRRTGSTTGCASVEHLSPPLPLPLVQAVNTRLSHRGYAGANDMECDGHDRLNGSSQDLRSCHQPSSRTSPRSYFGAFSHHLRTAYEKQAMQNPQS
jgi:hypothetical protein